MTRKSRANLLGGILTLLVGGAATAMGAESSGQDLSKRYVGGFVLVGAQNVAFDVIVRADGTAHSTWVEGPGGAGGEKGTWKSYGNGVLVEYTSGWRDWLRVTDSGTGSAGLIQQATWKNGQSLLEKPFAVARALPIDAERALFVGVFSISREEGEANIDITLQSSGRAFSNAHGDRSLVPGIWWLEKDRARMIWADGWRNEFARTAEGFSHKTWRPGNDFDTSAWKSHSLEALAFLPSR